MNREIGEEDIDAARRERSADCPGPRCCGVAALVTAAPVVRVLPSAVLLLFEPDPPRLGVPVQGVSYARIVDSFGAPRSGGRRHKGIDIFAVRGKPVRSTTRGLVLHVGEDRLGGRTGLEVLT